MFKDLVGDGILNGLHRLLTQKFVIQKSVLEVRDTKEE